MDNKVLEFIIRAKDATAAGISKARQSFQGLSNKVGASLKSMTGSMLGLVGVSVSVGAAVAGFAKTIKAAFEFERYETQFKVLFGSLDQAKQHIADLQKFSAETPFQFGDIAQASRQLNILTGGIMGGTESLKLVGDAAAATGAGFGELSMWVGRAYGAIKAGRPFGEAAMRLMELGVLTPDVRAEMEKLQASGASNAEVWGKLQEALERYRGGMEELSKTGEGLFSTLKDNWNLALAKFGESFMGISKDGIGTLTEKLQELQKDGSIQIWAEKAAAALRTVIDVVSKTAKGIKWLYENSGIQDSVQHTKAAWAAAGAISTGDFKGAGKAYMKEASKGKFTGALNRATGDITGAQAELDKEAKAKAEHEKAIREKATKEVLESEKAAAEKEKTEKQRMADDLAKAQAETDAKNAAKAAKDKKKAHDKWVKEQEKLWDAATKKALKAQEKQAKELAAEKVKMEKKALRGQIEVNAGQLAQQQPGVAAAQNRLQAANAAVDQAWGWVRDPRSFKDQLRREKEDAKAQAKFEKDAERLQNMQDWRTKQLSAKDEAVRRMILAKEEQEAAKNQLQKIERHVANLQAIRQDLQKALNAAGG